tara:strand:+ start:51 stop:359 length:309 start_codon:yes stop_codon:yes gene_type:complete
MVYPIGDRMSEKNKNLLRALMPVAGLVLDMRQGKYQAQNLSTFNTLARGQSCDLKIDTGSTRIWLSRCSKVDGMPYDNMVTVEMLIGGVWKTMDKYDGGSVE